MIYGFSHFHPLKGEPPHTLHWIGSDIVIRARTIIAHRNLTQIKTAIGIVNWLVDQSPIHDMAWQELTRQAALADGVASTSSKNKKANLSTTPITNALEPDLLSDVTALRLCIGQYDLSGYSPLADLKWSELFAVLALGLIDRANNDEAYYERGKKVSSNDYYDYRVIAHVTPWLIQAMDAVTTAEGLFRFEALSDGIAVRVKKQISLKNKRAGILRHAQTAQAVLALHDFYRKGKFKSLRDCVHLFIEKYPKLVEHLAPTNRLRTLANRLSTLTKSSRTTV